MEERTTFAAETGTLTGHGNILTGEASGYHVNHCEIVFAAMAHVGEDRNCRPMVLEDADGLRFDFDLPRAGQTGHFKGVIETADADEERAESERHLPSRFSHASSHSARACREATPKPRCRKSQ